MLQKGDHIDIWVVEKPLGSGGMGSVYRCHNRKATRILAAVKVLESNLRKYPEAEARFIREAEILFQLDHPNIVKVRNVRTDVDPPYLEMEFVAGESLEDRLRRGALPYAEAIEYMQQMASAIAYLHQKGVRHRDIKPANLLVSPNKTMKLVDFGLAMEADTTRITQQGMTFGTVSYAPPEWIAPDTLDASKWDLYAIGVVFYEMLTGKVAFPVSGQGSARQQAMQVIVGKQGHPPLDPGEHFHDDVRKLIRDMTKSDASKRVSSAAEAVRRTRKLVRSLRKESGVTLAPAEDELSESWNHNLDKTPAQAKLRADTWMSSELDADDTLQAPPGVNADSGQTSLTPVPKQRVVTASMLNGPNNAAVSPPTITAFRSGVALIILGLVGVATLGVGVAGFAYQSSLSASPRPVEVVVTGITSDSKLGIRVDGLEPSSANGLQYRFSAVPIGPTQIVSLLGDRCQVAACPGAECPTWCVVQEHELNVSAGGGSQIVPLQLAPPNPRRVKLNLAKIDGDWPLDFNLGPRVGKQKDDAIVFDALVPGDYTLTARVGACKATSLGCWHDEQCEDGCNSYRQRFIVPFGEGQVEWDFPMPSPVPVAVAVVAPKPPPRPKAVPTPSPKGAAHRAVLASEFASWLGSHPQWQQESAIAEGRAKAGYLKGWSGATPPAGTANKAVLDVSWYAANAYCKGHGGLADIADEPLRWQESPTAPYIELRSIDGKPGWRANDGRDSPRIGLADIQALTGFRCKR